jgi:hypothetical protein
MDKNRCRIYWENLVDGWQAARLGKWFLALV